jgi:hypothetical protein
MEYEIRCKHNLGLIGNYVEQNSLGLFKGTLQKFVNIHKY